MKYRSHLKEISEAKIDWPRGPWHQEPDSKEWVDEETGLSCEIMRGPAGAWCGYVGVPKEHPAYGLDYNGPDDAYDINPTVKWWRIHVNRRFEYAIYDVRVHGGLTFAGNRGDEKHWFGFDCAHAGDFCPRHSKPDMLGMPTGWGGLVSYRDMDYAINETKSLAKQLAAMRRLK